MVLGLLAVSCGSGEGEEGTSSTSVVTTPVLTSTTEATTTTEPASDDQEIEGYLVVMSNLASDIDSQAAEFECSYNEQFSPGFCDGNFVEEGEEFEPPPEPTEEELLEYQRGYWLGTFDLHLAHADVLESVVAPRGFESAHQNYVNSYHAYFSYIRDQVAGLTDLGEFVEFFNAIFDPLAALPDEHEQLLLAVVETCRSLEGLGTDAGYRSDLGCPTPPPEAISINVEISDQWSAMPNPLPVGDGLVHMTITNTGAETIRPVVLDIFEGDPLDLPVFDGVVDLSRSGAIDPASRYAAFGLAYWGDAEIFTGEDSNLTGEEPSELLPGESVEAVIWSDGTMLIFDYRQGEFEAGAYVVVERSGT
jgi:hypothetical protein